QARKLGFYESSAGGVEFEERYLARVAALTPADLREAAERHLRPEAAALCALLPESGEKLEEAELLALLHEAAADARRAAPRPAGPSRWCARWKRWADRWAATRAATRSGCAPSCSRAISRRGSTCSSRRWRSPRSAMAR